MKKKHTVKRRPFRPFLSARAATVAVAVGALLGLSVAATPAYADARATCEMQDGVVLRDMIGNTFTKALYCDNFLPADLYGRPTFSAPVTGWLALSPSWFTCYSIGPKDTQGNDVWYYTQGDRVGELPYIKGWGNVPAEMVQLSAGMSHPVAGLPRCPWY
ncbi:Secreted protein OS=Streptomyces alboniger OX=132473 GN=CP975_32430 PE=4 SV=1 [Streptomyces alboniger]